MPGEREPRSRRSPGNNDRQWAGQGDQRGGNADRRFGATHCYTVCLPRSTADTGPSAADSFRLVIQFDINGRRAALQPHEADGLATSLRDLGLEGGAGSVAALALSYRLEDALLQGHGSIRLHGTDAEALYRVIDESDVDPRNSISAARLLLALTAATGMPPLALVHLPQPEAFHLIDVPELRPEVGEEFLPGLKACSYRPEHRRRDGDQSYEVWVQPLASDCR